MNTLEALVSLNLIPQIGSRHAENLLQYFSKPQDIFRASPKDLTQAVGESLAQKISSFDVQLLKNDLALAEKSGVRIITRFCAEYPALLKEIPGAPLVLYVWGGFLPSDNLAVGIVGARAASLYGLANAEKFGSQLALEGVTIVSGLARGVDTYAHRGALKVKGRTIAVMGSGLGHIYPPENAQLAKQISASGAVISEFPMDAKPLAHNFPRRNRLISGLSLGVLITEAGRNSGALITADFALEQGREVFALPGRIDASGSIGSNMLLKQGAKLVTDCADIFEELNLNASAVKPDLPQARERIETEDEGLLYERIGEQAVTWDDLLEATSWENPRMAASVLKLRLKKIIKELPGKQFVRA